MSNFVYTRLCSDNDIDIAELIEIHQLPEVASYIHLSDNYFHYVSSTDGVYFYKIYHDNTFIGSIHLETQNSTLFMDVLVFPKYQRKGFGAKILKDLQDDIFELGYTSIEVSIDEKNTASLRLFESVGFTRTSQEDELVNFIYQR